jgi:capsular polysaccharide transport system permease protein
MRTLEPIEAKAPPLAAPPPERLRERLLRINRLFLLTVLLPTTLSILYYGFLASDVYISESRFVIRSPQKAAAAGLGALLQGAGFTRSQDDTYTVHDFISSQDALRQLDRQFGFAAIFRDRGVDRVSRFGGLDFDTSFEALHRYYQKRIVKVTSDTSSSITTLQVRAFSASDARNINASLLEMSEKLVNQLSERGRQDMIRFSQAEVAKAEGRAKAAALALSAYRNAKGVFDPEKQSALQLQQVARLQEELIAAKTQLAQVTLVSKNNPQVPVLEKQVELLQAEIAAETARVAGGERSLSRQAAEYERLALERGFAEKQLAAALASLEQARNEAQRKQLYLERIVQPSLPDRAGEPRRMRSVMVSFIVGMIFWGILTLLITGVREHHD